jgi:hypothetical protein
MKTKTLLIVGGVAAIIAILYFWLQSQSQNTASASALNAPTSGGSSSNSITSMLSGLATGTFGGDSIADLSSGFAGIGSSNDPGLLDDDDNDPGLEDDDED